MVFNGRNIHILSGGDTLGTNITPGTNGLDVYSDVYYYYLL